MTATGQPGASDAERGEARGSSLLARVSSAMVQAKKEYFGKGPTQAKSYLLDDFLLVVMRGGLTTAERTMLDAGEEDQVRSFRQGFENQMTVRLTKMVEDLTGRKVITYQSQVLFDPDVVIEFFMFDDTVDPPEREATVAGQTEDDSIGEVRGE
jgi:uncharacterized protein YbcI